MARRSWAAAACRPRGSPATPTAAARSADALLEGQQTAWLGGRASVLLTVSREHGSPARDVPRLGCRGISPQGLHATPWLQVQNRSCLAPKQPIAPQGLVLLDLLRYNLNKQATEPYTQRSQYPLSGSQRPAAAGEPTV